MGRESIIEFAKSLANLPTLNTLTGNLPTLLKDEEISFTRLASIISFDPGLSFRLISAANSPWYNRGTQVTSVNVALNILGLDEVRNLVMCAIFYDGLLKKSGLRKKDAFDFWRHSLLTGFATKMLACGHEQNMTDPVVQAEECFTAGLLHDIGKVPFVVYPELRSASVLSSHCATEKEQKKFGIDHCEVGFFMAREWKLPESYQNAIRSHHEERLTRSAAKSVPAMVRDADILVTQETEDEEMLAFRAAVEKEAQGVMAIFSL